MKISNKYFLCGLLSYVLWGFLPIFLKKLDEYNHYNIIFFRILFSAIFLVVFLLLNYKNTFYKIYTAYKKSNHKFFIMLLLNAIGGFLLVSNWITYVFVVNKINIHTAAFGYMILPITTAFLALVILKEKLSFSKWVAIAISVLSCYIISNININEVIYIIIIAMTYSLYLISQRKNTIVPRNINLAIQMLFGSIVMAFFNDFSSPIMDLHFNFWFYITLIVVFFTVTPLLLNLFALNGMTSSELSFLIYINPIISFIIGIVGYHENLDPLSTIAYFLLSISVVIFNWEWIKKLLKRPQFSLRKIN